MRASRIILPALVAVAAVFLGACSSSIGTRIASPTPVTDRSDTGVVGHGMELLPSETLTDWVTYADAVVTVKVVDTRRGELSADEQEAGEGLELRSVTLEVADVIWRSGRGADTPTQMTWSYGGWVVSADDEERRFLIEDAVQLDASHEYLVPILFGGLPEDQWNPLAAPAILSFDGGVAGAGEAVFTSEEGEPHRSSAAKELWGLDLSAVADILANTAPDPAAADFMDLPALERYQAVAEGTR